MRRHMRAGDGWQCDECRLRFSRPASAGQTAVRGFVVTREWLHAHGTAGRGWTRAQLAVLGVTWPPRKGWLSGLRGRVVPLEAARAFERAGQRAEDVRRPGVAGECVRPGDRGRALGCVSRAGRFGDTTDRGGNRW